MAVTEQQLDDIGGAIHELHLFAIRNNLSEDTQLSLAGLANQIEKEITRFRVSRFMNRFRIARTQEQMKDFVNSTPSAKQEPENDNYIRCKNPNHTCRSNGVCLTCNP